MSVADVPVTGSGDDPLNAVRRQSTRARWAIALLAIAAVVDLVALASGVAQASLLSEAAAGLPVSDAAADATDARQRAIGTLQLTAIIVAGIVFLVWLHRAYANMRLIGSRQTNHAPGWAVGYWFIPLLNLIRPYQVVSELWQRSHSGNDMESTDGLPAPSLVSWWWGAFLVAWALGRVYSVRIDAAATWEQLHSATWWGIGSDAFGVVAAVLAIQVVRTIDSAQVASTKGSAPAPNQPVTEVHSPGAND